MNMVYGALAAVWRQGNTHGSNGNRFLLEFDVEERIGYTWGSWKKGRMLSLFTGFGYRHLGEAANSSGSAITFNYNELYVPVGVLIEGSLHPLVSCGFNAQWMPQVYSTLTIVPLTGARWILTKKVMNFRGELPLTIYVSRARRFSFTIQPFFEYWQDGHTSARTQLGTVLHVPGNTYLFVGGDLNLRYSF
jgi:hypothetical protein